MPPSFMKFFDIKFRCVETVAVASGHGHAFVGRAGCRCRCRAVAATAGMNTISSTHTPIRSSSRPPIFRLSTITTLVAAFINKISEELGVRRKGFAISKETLTILPLKETVN